MPFLAIFSITGIYTGTSYEKITSYILFLLLLLFYLYINIKENKYSIKYKIAVTSFLVLFFIFFYIYSSVFYSAIDNNNINNDKKSIRIIGYVKNLNEINEKELNFTINCTDGFNYNVVLSDIKDNSSIKTGDIYIIEGKLYKPQKASNKGQFDYQKYCYSKNVTATIYTDYENITNIGNKTILYKIGILRNKAVKRASMNLSKQEKNISVALITGGSEQIDDEIDLLFRKSGLSHLLSISGTHFSILILPMALLSILLVRRKYINFIIFTCLILILLVFTGMKIGAIRSAICFICIAVCKTFFYDAKKSSVISIALVLILVINPLSIYNTGFILSFGSVVSILLFSKKVTNCILKLTKYCSSLLEKILLSKYVMLKGISMRINNKKHKTVLKYLFSGLSLIISVQPAILILSYKLFHVIYPYSLISNIIIFPIIPVLVLSIWLSILSPQIFNPVFSVCLKIIMKVAEWVANFSYSQIYLKDISTISIILIVASLVIYKMKFKNNIVTKNLLVSFFLILSVICFIPNICAKMIFFDVGQGDSALFCSGKGTNILIDTGKYIDPSCIAYYTGQRLDIVIITHPDNDHCGGLFEILDNLNVKKVILPKSNHIKNLTFIEDLKVNYKNIEVVQVEENDIIKTDDFIIRVLNPEINKEYSDINDASVIFSLVTKQCKFLMTGDADITNIHVNELYKTDILKIPHHGDDKVINRNILSYVNPDISIISVGKNNTYGHPGKNTLAILDLLNLKYLRTDINGSIQIYMIFNKYMVYKYQ